MEIKEMTRAELQKSVRAHMENASDKDLKWFYCYYNGFDEWPIVTDEVVPNLASGQGVWGGGEEVPF